MRWQGRDRSSNIEDRRGMRGPVASGGGALLLMRVVPFLLRSKIGRIVLALGAAVFLGGKFLGFDVMPLLGLQSSAPQTAQARPAAENELAEFVSVVLADTEITWHEQFKKLGKTYQEPKLGLFTQSVNSACGRGQAAMGPFYCPADQKVYIDLSFYNDLKQRHKAPGDFAQAYVVAHEVGHHIQTLLGISSKVHKAKQKLPKAQANVLSVKQELQADCFAGIWGYNAKVKRQMLEQGDIEEALTAAAAIGDDRLQQQATGRIVPESFTHGTSAQRVQWFKKGFTTGDFNACDTFSAVQI